MWKKIALVIAVLFLIYIVTISCEKGQKKVSFAPEYEVYGTMSCGYTVKMIDHMKQIGKTYKFIDISKNPSMYTNVLEMYSQKHIGVPFVVHVPTQTFFVGFKQLKI